MTGHQSTLEEALFGDLNYSATELDRPEGFRVGQMVAHVIANLDEGFTFFGEVSLTGKDAGYSIEVNPTSSWPLLVRPGWRKP